MAQEKSTALPNENIPHALAKAIADGDVSWEDMWSNTIRVVELLSKNKLSSEQKQDLHNIFTARPVCFNPNVRPEGFYKPSTWDKHLKPPIITRILGNPVWAKEFLVEFLDAGFEFKHFENEGVFNTAVARLGTKELGLLRDAGADVNELNYKVGNAYSTLLADGRPIANPIAKFKWLARHDVDMKRSVSIGHQSYRNPFDYAVRAIWNSNREQKHEILSVMLDLGMGRVVDHLSGEDDSYYYTFINNGSLEGVDDKDKEFVKSYIKSVDVRLAQFTSGEVPPTKMTRQDVIRFYATCCEADAFSPELWREHGDQLYHLTQLLPEHVKQAIDACAAEKIYTAGFACNTIEGPAKEWRALTSPTNERGA